FLPYALCSSCRSQVVRFRVGTKRTTLARKYSSSSVLPLDPPCDNAATKMQDHPRRDTDTMKANVVVVGGGVNGTSTAFHLAKMGMKDVVLVERQQLAAGATGKSGALVRMHYTNPFESKLAYESLKIFRNWAEEVGGDCGFEGIGFVQIAPPGYEEAF